MDEDRERRADGEWDGDLVVPVDRKEVLRYLGYGREQPDGQVLGLVESCIKELTDRVRPRHLTREYALELLPGDKIFGGCFQVESRALSRNLKDCGRVIVFAATLGAEVDYLLQRYGRLAMSRAVVLQAASAAMIEAYCDLVCRELAERYAARGLYLRPRFSPGYGDLPLSIQPDLLNALEAGKRIGIKLTESFLMMPSKSVSAVIGVSEKPHRCEVKGCEACEKTDCPYRRKDS